MSGWRRFPASRHDRRRCLVFNDPRRFCRLDTEKDITIPESPAQILAIAQQLHRNERPRRASVKTLLKWFGAKRRGANVIANIEHALRSAGLATNPDLAQAGHDDYLTFILIAESQQTASPPVPESVRVRGGDQDDPKPVQQEPQSDPPDQPSDDYLEPEGDDEPQAADDARPVVSKPADWTITSLREKWDGGLLDLQPAFQREYVWKLRPELPSRLIESVLLEIPIPPLYFGRLPGGKLEVIDG